MEALMTSLRATREAIQTIAEPLDAATRLLNNKRGYPPLRLRQAVGNLNDFEGSAGEYVAYLKLLCDLQPGDDLLDVGCGCGTILTPVTEQHLSDYVGTYYGYDIDSKAIQWCQDNFRKLNLQFRLIDTQATTWIPALPYFDVVLCKSLFTHLFEWETKRYLHEIYNAMKPWGKCLSTWFIINGRSLHGRYTFPYRHGPTSFQRNTKPELAVAYDEDYLQNLFRDIGFEPTCYYGSWRGDVGNHPKLSFQDVVILEKPNVN